MYHHHHHVVLLFFFQRYETSSKKRMSEKGLISFSTGGPVYRMLQQRSDIFKNERNKKNLFLHSIRIDRNN